LRTTNATVTVTKVTQITIILRRLCAELSAPSVVGKKN